MACFHGKKVCYMPTDTNGDEITTTSFTFKIQTSKFCPTVADEVALDGSIAIQGRNSFKPNEDGKEGPTDGDTYFQGEKIHILGTTTSNDAKIITTKVIMVEVTQDLTGLIKT